MPYDMPYVIVDTLRCAFCNLYLSCGPIQSNADVHGICGRCKPSEDITEKMYRNFIYEKSMATIKFPCIYDKHGCEERFLFDQVATHENNCRFKPLACPSLWKGCDWEGPVMELYEHFKLHDLILKDGSFEIEIEEDASERNVIMIAEGELPILLQYNYVCAEKILYFDMLHFCGENSEVFGNLKFVNKSSHGFCTFYEKFNCKPYVSKNFDVARMQKIDFKKLLPLLKNPEFVIVSVLCDSDSVKNSYLKCSDKRSLDKILCHYCGTFMVPPIVKCLIDDNDCNNSCKNCGRGKISYNLDLFNYCKELNYPCKWTDCHFVDKHYNIRQHEFKCNYATFECPLSCDGFFNLQSFLKHVHEAHNAKRFDEKITVALTSDGTFCYFMFDDQLLILQIVSADPDSEVSIRHFNLVSNYDCYFLHYYFVHSHCKVSTGLDYIETSRLVNNGTAKIDIRQVSTPECFKKYKERSSIVIHEIKKATMIIS